MKLVFATNNADKICEVRAILGNAYEVLSLNELGVHEDIPETADTLEGNALMKAQYIHTHYGFDCFADDTGLEVEILGGEPGIHSARYADIGSDHDSEANIDKLLLKLLGKDNRRARFRTVIALVMNGETHLFEGEVRGSILTERHGTGGFGYDPVFKPEGYNQTFAEMGEEKNIISHRARAITKLSDFLIKQKKSITNDSYK